MLCPVRGENSPFRRHIGYPCHLSSIGSGNPPTAVETSCGSWSWPGRPGRRRGGVRRAALRCPAPAAEAWLRLRHGSDQRDDSPPGLCYGTFRHCAPEVRLSAIRPYRLARSPPVEARSVKFGFVIPMVPRCAGKSFGRCSREVVSKALDKSGSRAIKRPRGVRCSGKTIGGCAGGNWTVGADGPW